MGGGVPQRPPQDQPGYILQPRHLSRYQAECDFRCQRGGRAVPWDVHDIFLSGIPKGKL